MAVSHQWYIQWNSPSMYFTDITKRYDEGTRNWNELGSDYLHQEDNRVINDQINLRGSVIDHGLRPDSSKQKDYRIIHDHRGSQMNQRGSAIDKQTQLKERMSYRTKATPSLQYGQNPSAGMTMWLALLGVAQYPTQEETDTRPLKTLYKWKELDFVFPTLQQRSIAITNRIFVPQNTLPLGLEVWRDRVWVTVPSWRRGVPATLTTVSRYAREPSPPLRPYPDWSFHRAYNNGNNCTGLTSVFRVKVDPCGRLWVLDSGQIDSQDNPKQICPPSIVVFDLATDRLLARYPIPTEYVLQNSLFANIIVDTRTNDCSDLHVYIADTWRFGLIIFRHFDRSFWKFSHHFFYPDPFASNYTVHGVNFQWVDGIFGLALSPLNQFDDRILFFHSLSGYREFFVQTSILRDSSRVNNSANDFNLFGESRGLYGQSSASAIDRRGVMFYGLVSRDSIGCWNTLKPYLKKTLGVVATSASALIFPNDIKIDQDIKQNVWVLSNKLPMFQASKLDPNDYNYRILYGDTNESVQGTVCEPTNNLIKIKSSQQG